MDGFQVPLETSLLILQDGDLLRVCDKCEAPPPAAPSQPHPSRNKPCVIARRGHLGQTLPARCGEDNIAARPRPIVPPSPSPSRGCVGSGRVDRCAQWPPEPRLDASAAAASTNQAAEQRSRFSVTQRNVRARSTRGHVTRLGESATRWVSRHEIPVSPARWSSSEQSTAQCVAERSVPSH